MYLRKLKVRNLKLLRDITIDFTRKGKPRPFTVFVGENGLCKTTLLQAIAVAATGVDRANQLADVVSYPDVRRPRDIVDIEAEFSFSHDHHAERTYPELDPRPEDAPRLRSCLRIHPGADTFDGYSYYLKPDGSRIELPHRAPDEILADPLRQARRHNLDHWFVAGYGVGRMLPLPARTTTRDIASPSRDRLLSLFKPDQRVVVGTGFADLFPRQRANAFCKQLERVFVNGILPRACALTLQALGHVNGGLEQVKAHRLTLKLSTGRIDVPTVWLSDGYQGAMAWVADLVGQMWWGSKRRVIPPKQMEGICLIDQIDLNLHPSWQAGFIIVLKEAFPRIQFIATTHSPMVLPGLEQDEIIRLGLNEQDRVVKLPSKESPSLMTGSRLYHRFFGIDRLEPRQVDDALFQYGTLASDPGRSAAQDRKVQQLLEFLRLHKIDPGWDPVPRERRSGRLHGRREREDKS